MDQQNAKLDAKLTGGQSAGKPAGGEHPEGTYSPTGGPGFHHWQDATITEPGLDDRGNVFFAAIEMTRMPMILSDPNLPDCPVVFANRAFQDLTGYVTDEIVGRNCRFLQGAQTDREKIRELRRALQEQRAISMEILNYKRDGTPFWNAVFIAPVHATDGRLLYFFASQLDITRRRMSEEAFRQAQKMESIGQLTAGLAHDFNNLLQVMNGNLDALRSRLQNDDLLRGSKLTKQLLAFARKTRLEPKVLDLNELVTEFAGLLESTVGEHGELEFQLRRRLPSIQVDPAHLEMALLNVVINARDASPAGSVIRLGTSAVTLEDEDGREQRYVALSVTDQGQGMPAYVRQRATEPFFTTKPTGKGTGLGLAMVHGFVQQSLGRLDIDSEPGQGATVRMLFPVFKEAQVPSRAAASLPAPARLAGRQATETILLVEDNEDVLTIALEHLTALGYKVLTARNAEEALDALARGGKQIDLMFSDILMPGSMNGIMLAERVRANFPDIAILLATGYNEDLAVDGPTASTMDVIGKPYRRSELSDRVRTSLNRRADARRRPARLDNGPRHEA